MKHIYLLTILLISCVREPLAPTQGDEDLYQKGQNFLSAGDYNSARISFQELQKEYPSSSRVDNAILGQAEAERNLGFVDSAVWTLRDMPTGSSLFGTSLLKQGQYMLDDATYWPADSAVTAFRKTILWDGDFTTIGEAWYSLGQSFYKIVGTAHVPRPTYYDSALVAYSYVRSHFENHSRNSDALYRIGWVYYQKSQWTVSADSLEKFSTLFPNHSSADGALYWAAKARGNARQDCTATRLMNLMLERYPYSNYRANAESEIAGWSCEP